MSSLVEDVRSVLTEARSVVAPDRLPELDAAIERLDEPLRVAIAGKVKAGKSTLLNALVGDELAPTDAGECTRIVTWYEDGVTYRVEALTEAGDVVQVPFERVEGAIQPRLGELSADDIDRLNITWPAEPLSAMTLIDTPGIDSISVDVSARSHRFLAPGEDRATDADAVLYLLRHLHPNDVRFLESFHDDEVAQGTPTNAIGILARADEIGGCELEALDIAARASSAYVGDPKLRALCQTVVPVAGLLAQGGATLRQDDYDDLAALARLEEPARDALLMTAERFVSRPASVPPERRADLIGRLGLYGVRLSVDMITNERVGSASDLARHLVGRSGIDELRHLLATRFAARGLVLKARSALAVLRGALSSPTTDPGSAHILRRIDEIQLHAHEFREVVLLSRLRSGALASTDSARTLLSGDVLTELERVLGGQGIKPHQRLGLPSDADVSALLAEAQEVHQRLALLLNHPLMSGGATEAISGAQRSVEGILGDLAGADEGTPR